MMKKLRSKLLNLLIILIFFVGAGILFYPTISDLWNRYRNEQLITEYSQTVSKMSEDQYEEYWQEAQEYNAEHTYNWIGSDGFDQELDYTLPHPYDEVLNVNGDGIMGSIEIPKIDVKLAIYHGMGVTALEHGVGHIDGTSLPIGGESTHAALSAHRGLPSAKLFTDVDQLEIGDIFIISILDKKLAYKIDQIKTVLPGEVDDLMIVEGKDYVTLVTCTPYGVNTHRMLLRGERTEYKEEEIPKQTLTDKIVNSNNAQKLLIAGCMVVIIVVIVLGLLSKRRKEGRSNEK
jgi:sortase A